MFRPGDNPKHNCVAYSDFYYLSNYNQYKALPFYQCPESAIYKIKDKKSCIDICTKDIEYKYLFNGNCFKECPFGTQVLNYTCKVNPNKCSSGEDDDLYLYNNDITYIEV